MANSADLAITAPGARRALSPAVLTVVLCALCVLVDGADFQVIGFVAPAIVRDFGVNAAAMTPVFTAGILGLMLGSVLMSPLADRFGRRPSLIVGMLTFGAFMLATVTAGSIQELALFRFATCFGLGSIMPNACALAAEMVSPARRALVTIAVSSCFALGAVLGGIVAALLIPDHGWRAVFYAGAAAPLAIGLLLVVALPESPGFLARRRSASADLTARKTNHASVVNLFSDGLAPSTLFFWAGNLLNLAVLMALSSWLPTLLIRGGLSADRAMIIGTVLQVGGVLGGLLLALPIERLGFRKVLAVNFLFGSVALMLLGQSNGSPAAMLGLVAFIGFAIVGGQNAFNGWVTNRYEVGLRATGTGWALGVGRLGSIVGPIAAGLLIARQLDLALIMSALALPPALLGLMILLLRIPSHTLSKVDAEAPASA